MTAAAVDVDTHECVGLPGTLHVHHAVDSRPVRSVVKLILQFCREHHLPQSFAALSAETQARAADWLLLTGVPLTPRSTSR